MTTRIATWRAALGLLSMGRCLGGVLQSSMAAVRTAHLHTDGLRAEVTSFAASASDAYMGAELGSLRTDPIEWLESTGVVIELPKDGHDSVFWRQFFHCTRDDGFNGVVTLAHAAIMLAGAALLLGVGVSGAFVASERAENENILSVRSTINPAMEKATFWGTIIGGIFAWMYSVLANAMIIVGFAYCGYTWYVAIATILIMVSQVIQAEEYAQLTKDGREWWRRFFKSIIQLRVFSDAHECIQQGKVTLSFARGRFLQSVTESGPMALFCSIVVYKLQQEHNLWLVLGICGSIIGTAWGLAVWLDFSAKLQLEEEFATREGFHSMVETVVSGSLEDAATQQVPTTEILKGPLRWYHQCLWICYFAMDFGLRLLTLGVFLSRDELRHVHGLLLLIPVIYLAIIHYCTRTFDQQRELQAAREAPEEWRFGDVLLEIERKHVQQRLIDGIFMATLVHVLPADMRLAPKKAEEGRALLLLHPDLRSKIQWTVIPFRAAEYALLGAVALLVKFNYNQMVALVSMYVVLHVLLCLVLYVQSDLAEKFSKEEAPVPRVVQERLGREVSRRVASEVSAPDTLEAASG